MSTKFKIGKLLPKTIKRRVKGFINSHADIQNASCKYELNIRDVNRMEHKVALITGGTGAIGSAICFRMAMEGAIVCICGRNESKIKNISNHILSSYPNAKIEELLLDVQNEEEIKNVVSKVIDKYGRCDILVNNAGGGPRGSSNFLYKQKVDLIDEILRTNLRGTILCTKYVSAQMVKQGFGRIINMSSVMGMNGQAWMSEYSASKAGIIGFTKSMALELAQYGITVNCISPGMVRQVVFDAGMPNWNTERNAIGHFGKTDDVANVVAFLVSNEADYITGQNIVVDGGRSIGLK